jgi:hypothetical protein
VRSLPTSVVRLKRALHALSRALRKVGFADLPEPRMLADGFGFCQGDRSDAQCPRKEFSLSPLRIVCYSPPPQRKISKLLIDATRGVPFRVRKSAALGRGFVLPKMDHRDPRAQTVPTSSCATKGTPTFRALRVLVDISEPPFASGPPTSCFFCSKLRSGNISTPVEILWKTLGGLSSRSLRISRFTAVHDHEWLCTGRNHESMGASSRAS